MNPSFSRVGFARIFTVLGANVVQFVHGNVIGGVEVEVARWSLCDQGPKMDWGILRLDAREIGWPSGEIVFQTADKFLEGNPNCLADIAKFKDVESSFTLLVLTYERLRLIQAPPEFDLGQIRLKPNLAEEALELLL